MNNSLINENTYVIGFKLNKEVKDINKIFESIKYFYLGNKAIDQIIVLYLEDINKGNIYFKDMVSYDFKIEDYYHKSNLEPDIIFDFSNGNNNSVINPDSIYLYKNDNNVSFLYPFNVNNLEESNTNSFRNNYNKIRQILLSKKLEMDIRYLSNNYENEEEILSFVNNNKELKDNFYGFINIKDFFNNKGTLIIVNSLTFEVILETYKTFLGYFDEKRNDRSASQYFAKMAIQFQKTKKIELNDVFFEVSINFDNEKINVNLNELIDLSSLVFIYKYLKDFFK